MYIKSTKFPVMEGEPHLGSITEHELIAKKYELEDFILAEVERDHYIQAEYDMVAKFLKTNTVTKVGTDVMIHHVNATLGADTLLW